MNDHPPKVAEQQAGPVSPTSPGTNTDAVQAPRGIKDAGREVVAAAANAGGVKVTNELCRQAEAALSAGRDIVYGQQLNISVGQQRRPAAERLVDSVLDELRLALWLPNGYDALVTAVRRRHLTVLRGPAGCGKWAVAGRLLLAVGVREIREFASGVDLGDLGADQFETGVGYLVSDLAPAQARTVGGETLRRLQNALSGADISAHLIITINDDVALANGEAAQYTVRLEHPPSARDVLTGQLRWRFKTEEADRLLAQPEVAALIDELLPADSACGRARELARLIWEERRDGSTDVARIRFRAKQSADEDFQAWFEGLSADASLSCLAVSLAVLNGLPHQTVADAAEALRVRLEPPPSMVPGMPLPPNWALAGRPKPFNSTRVQRIRAIRADVVAASLPTRYGQTPTEVVSYTNRRYPSMVLDWVWREYDDIRPDLIAWLRDLGGHSMEPVRIWAALTVGTLASRNFDYVVDRIIRPWAASDSENRRESAAFALQIPAIDHSLYQQVLTVVEGWGHHDDGKLKITAVRAYGASIGRVAPQKAVAALEEFTRCGDVDIAFAVGRSLAELIDCDRDLAMEVIAAVRRWSLHRDTDRRDFAQLVSLFIAAELVDTVDGADGASHRWPALLRIGDRDPVSARLVADAWHDLLVSPALWRDARDVLTQWSRSVDADSQACQALGRLAREIVASAHGSARERTTKILLRLAHQWSAADNSNATPRAAAAIRASLLEGTY